jgi:tRNA threonylcarbamoyladenosine biosynthesis protein TsaE
MIVDSRSPEETWDLGRRLGAVSGAGTLIALVGELGAGKTRFVKGLAVGLGVADEDGVISPTFVLMNLHEGHVRFAHFDFYRLDAVDLPSLGFYDVRDECAVVIEWADKVDARLLGDHVRIDFEVTGLNSRRLRVVAWGCRSEALLGRMESRNKTGPKGV